MMHGSMNIKSNYLCFAQGYFIQTSSQTISSRAMHVGHATPSAKLLTAACTATPLLFHFELTLHKSLFVASLN